MGKSTRIVRKYIAIFLIVLMSINSFGAVVSDNDGSAFITKAEFDSLKNDFQAQIDQYNTSIDSKIDGAIASYLAGISISKQGTVKPEFSGYTVLAMNLDKIDKLKFGKMDFDISASTMNLTWNYLDMSGRNDGSSGACALKMSRKSDKHGEGFEVFRVDKKNQLKYSNDLRFHFTATRTEHSHSWSGNTFVADVILGRWHATWDASLYEIADSDTIDYTDYNQRRKFRPDLSDSSWLQFWQTGGVGFQCGFFGRIRRSANPAEATNPDFDEYLTSVNTYDKATSSVIISTDALDGDENDIFCCFTGDDWTSDLITQRQNLYTYYDTTTYYYDTPDGAGLTTCQASTWTQPNWMYFRDLRKTGDVYDYYLNPMLQHTLVHGVTWVNYGRFDQQTGQPESAYIPNTAAPFYEMIPKISNKKLNILKNEVALDNVNGKYDGWNGLIYQGLPLLQIEKAGKMKFDLDLTYAEDDLNFAISSVPFDDNISVASYNSRSLSSVIDNWAIDGVKINNAGSVLTAGTYHTISIETGEKCNIFYKITPVDADSKKRNRVILPKEVLVEYND